MASVHLRHAGITEVALPGDQPAMLCELRKRWLPTIVLAWGERYDSPLWTDRNQNSAYVCKEYLNFYLNKTLQVITLRCYDL